MCFYRLFVNCTVWRYCGLLWRKVICSACPSAVDFRPRWAAIIPARCSSAAGANARWVGYIHMCVHFGIQSKVEIRCICKILRTMSVLRALKANELIESNRIAEIVTERKKMQCACHRTKWISVTHSTKHLPPLPLQDSFDSTPEFLAHVKRHLDLMPPPAVHGRYPCFWHGD